MKAELVLWWCAPSFFILPLPQCWKIMPSLDPLVGLCLSIMDVFRFTEDLEGRYDVVQN